MGDFLRYVPVPRTGPADVSWFATTPQAVPYSAALWPAIEQERLGAVVVGPSFRRPLQTWPNDGWLTGTFEQIARQWPAYKPFDYVLGPGFRRPPQTVPNDGWQRSTFNAIAQQWPAVDESAQRVVLGPSFKRPPQTVPNDGWAKGAYDDIASWWPGIEQNLPRRDVLGASFRRPAQTTPNDGWATGTFNQIARQWPGIEGDYRRYGTRRSFGPPILWWDNLEWISATFPAPFDPAWISALVPPSYVTGASFKRPVLQPNYGDISYTVREPPPAEQTGSSYKPIFRPRRR